MGDCLFCAISAGSIPSARVYEDDDVFGFLDIQPLREGHALLVPKKHAQHLEDLDARTASALTVATQRILHAARKTLGTEDATVAINNGPAAGQEIPHVHVHIIPRRPGDGAGPVHALFEHRPDMDKEDLSRLAEQLRQHALAAESGAGRAPPTSGGPSAGAGA